MKNFARSIPGKTILFLSLLLCLALTAAGASGIFLLFDENMYDTPVTEQKQQLLRRRVREMSYSAAAGAVSGDTAEAENLALSVSRPEGELLYRSPSYEEAAKDSTLYRYDFPVFGADGDELSYTYSIYISPSDIRCTETEQFALRLLDLLYGMRYAIYPVVLALVLLCIVLFIALLCVSGRRPRTDAVFPGPLGFVPFDVLCVLTGALLLGAAVLADGAFPDGAEILAYFGIAAAGAAAGIGLLMSAACRIKLRTLIRGTVIFKVLSLFRRGLGWLLRGILHLPSARRTVLVFCAAALLEQLVFFGFYTDRPAVLFFFRILEYILFLPAILYAVFSLKRLRTGIRSLAEGKFSEKIPLGGLTPDFRADAENLNRASEGLRAAVENELKSERMKTALITNVSHDIKTPLTSVINYADLISGEESENPKIREYSAVLLRQSEKLKRLVSDLVDASRASSGDVEISLEKCDARLFVAQADGEYRERMEAAELALLCETPREEVFIRADSRRMQRVFDNLMGNILKYAQPGTRVYLSLEEKDGSAVITLRNTSREMLNIDPAELTERFVRGDNARTGEGSGLGLAIAKDLTRLQGGELLLSIDGDLFRAELRFPVCGS